MSDQNFDDYASFLKLFYSRVIKGHSSVVKLTRGLAEIIEDVNKTDQNSLGISKISRKKSELSISGSNKSFSKSARSIRSLNNVKSAKNDYIYDSTDLKKVVLFGYLHHVISISNSETFNKIETMSRLLINSIEEPKISDKVKWERSVKEWKKIMQLLSHKTKVRWEKILSNAVSGLDDDFVEICGMKSLMNCNIVWENLNEGKDEILDQISSQLKIRIKYFELEKGEEKNEILKGIFKYQLKIGYLKTDNLYAFYVEKEGRENYKENDSEERFSQNYLSVNQSTKSYQAIQINNSAPQKIETEEDEKSKKSVHFKSEKSIGEEVKKRPTLSVGLLRKKMIRVIEIIQKEYKSNTNKMEDLECLINENNKDSKIKRMLDNRTIIEE